MPTGPLTYTALITDHASHLLPNFLFSKMRLRLPAAKKKNDDSVIQK